MSDSEDDDLKRAIAASLQDADPSISTSKPATNANPIMIESEDEDEDMKRAIGLSRQADIATSASTSTSTSHATAQAITTSPKGPDATKAPKQPTSHPTTTGGIPGLDRKAMEQERLARQALKRKADANDGGISPPPTKRAAKRRPSPPPPRPTPASLHAPHISPPCSQYPSAAHSSSSPPFPLYPHGAVLRTASTAHARTADTITFAELLQPSTLRLAVLSTFQIDPDWLLNHLSNAATKLILVLSAKSAAHRAQHEADTADAENLRLCFPPMPGPVNCMHSKLMLLSHGDRLRVAVPTANLTRYDWGETGVMENSVFVIDLSRRMEGGRCAEEELGRFGRELVRFCGAMGLGEGVVESMYEFDWRGAEGLAFVHSIGGEHTNEGLQKESGRLVVEAAEWRRTGAPGLGMAVRELGLARAEGEELEVDFVASSVGSVNDDFLSSLYLACKGDDGMTEFNWRANADNIARHAEKKRQGKAGKTKPMEADISGQNKLIASAKNNMRLFFPSKETVVASRGGTRAAGVICFREDWYDGDKFPKQIMHDCVSKRPGLLMHNKILYVRRKYNHKPSSDEVRSDAWAYVGSANFSESAWGKLTFNKTTKVSKLTCRNWECGVLIPVARRKDSPVVADETADAGKGDNDLDEVFAGTVPVPMVWPGASLSGKRPWYFAGFQ